MRIDINLRLGVCGIVAVDQETRSVKPISASGIDASLNHKAATKLKKPPKKEERATH